MKNTLYYGDNLSILREYIPDESIDLIYLDPPFNSNRTYNVLFKDESGRESEAQIAAFDDTWHWGPDAENTYYELITEGSQEVVDMIGALRVFIGTNQMMAYLVMMAIRLCELHRVLKPTGSIYLHCDPTASHYLKIVMDSIFGVNFFKSEIIWRRTGSHNSAKRFGPIHDTILFYGKSKKTLFEQVKTPYTVQYIENFFKEEDSIGKYQSVSLTGPGVRKGDSGKPWKGYNPTDVGRHWQPASYLYSKFNQMTGDNLGDYDLIKRLEILDSVGLIHYGKKKGSVPRYKYYLEDAAGVPLQDIWAYQPGTKGCIYGDEDTSVDEDVKWLSASDAERLGYPTQKPLGLLERIILSSCPEDGWILDPFCGCGTAVAAAEKLGRRWIGIDITHLAIGLQKLRVEDMFGLQSGKDYQVIGEPKSVKAAQQLAKDNRFQFEWWALSLVKATATGATPGSKRGQKGRDRGIDGVINFIDSVRGKPKRVLVQVKSGKVGVKYIRDLRGTIEREFAEIGVLITMQQPTRDMEVEAVTAGFYESELWQEKYPRLQILTITQLFEGANVKMPPAYNTFKRAQKEKKQKEEQKKMEL